MKDQILKALKSSIKEIDDGSIVHIYEFIENLDRIPVSTILTKKGLDNFFDNCLYVSDVQNHALDFFVFFKTNLELAGLGDRHLKESLHNAFSLFKSGSSNIDSDLLTSVQPIEDFDKDVFLALVWLTKTHSKTIKIYINQLGKG